MGQAIYHLGETNTKYSDTWQNVNEIHNQIAFNCNFDNIKGVIFFRYSSLVKGENEILNQGLDILKKDWKKRHNVVAGIIKKDNKIYVNGEKIRNIYINSSGNIWCDSYDIMHQRR
mgnify:CR=1 FL=1